MPSAGWDESMKGSMFIAVLLTSVLAALPAVSQREGVSDTINTPPNIGSGGKHAELNGPGKLSFLTPDPNKEHVPSAIAFTESLRIKTNADGTWQVDQRQLADGFLAYTSSGELIRVFLEPSKNENGEMSVAPKWRLVDETLGSIVISDGELAAVRSGDGYTECLKSMRLNNFTDFFIKDMVLSIRVDRPGQAERRLLVSASGVAEQDYISIEVPGIVTTAECVDLVYSVEVRQCTLRNGIPCSVAVSTQDNGSS